MAFTLIDLLLALAILMLAMSVALPFLGMFHESTLLDVQVQELSSTFDDARRFASYGKYGHAWGVRSLSGGYVLFAGTGYVMRADEFDEVHELPATFKLSGDAEVVFASVTGRPVTTATLLLTSENGRREIRINEEGLVTVRTP